ncbi:hypothetical protein DNTS_009505 [Danionella cerebrum]|uniref:Uncharacterized protein n=1 Tax=Danionella cerebrum TaxID=2873325 RepID=A0A553P539_9TELE|nr:hypothetical protein DNTS_009505 [Danionella translucida]
MVDGFTLDCQIINHKAIKECPLEPARKCSLLKENKKASLKSLWGGRGGGKQLDHTAGVSMTSFGLRLESAAFFKRSSAKTEGRRASLREQVWKRDAIFVAKQVENVSGANLVFIWNLTGFKSSDEEKRKFNNRNEFQIMNELEGICHKRSSTGEARLITHHMCFFRTAEEKGTFYGRAVASPCRNFLFNYARLCLNWLVRFL